MLMTGALCRRILIKPPMNEMFIGGRSIYAHLIQSTTLSFGISQRFSILKS